MPSERSIDPSALFKIGYGLYVLTSNDGTKDNGCIVNTVTQISNAPDRLSVSVSKLNYTHEILKEAGIFNVNCLTTEAPFSLFQDYGFRSGRDSDKFAGKEVKRTGNGIVYLEDSVNAVFSLKAESYLDMDSHGLFICRIEESRVLSDRESMTYAYYHANVKPKPQPKKAKGFVCKICGYVYEGEELPADFICPICKHPASDFEPIL